MKFNIDSIREVYSGFITVCKAMLKHEKYDGTMSGTLEREMVAKEAATAAIVRDINTDELILVKQFRFPAHESGRPWLLELVAGIVEKDENPVETLKREIREELGYEIEDAKSLFSFYTSPGYSSENIHLYYLEVDDSMKVEEGGGVEEEDEDIKIIRIPFYSIENLLEDDTIRDAKTLIGLQWAMRNSGSRNMV